MKPKTKIQIRIIELSKTLPKLSKEQKDFLNKKMHWSYVTFSYKKKHHCLECNQEWKGDITHTRILNKIICPKCKTDLKIASYYDKGFSVGEYASIITTVENMQVVRMFLCMKHLHKNKKPHYIITEVYQNWISNTGRIYNIHLTQSYRSGRYNDHWQYSSGLEFRSNRSYNQNNRCSVSPYFTFPKIKVLPVFKRNGIKGSLHKIEASNLFSHILTNNKIETLFKMKQYVILKEYFKSHFNIDNYWKSIKIVVKNNYKIIDAGIWIDYLDLLSFFNKDLNNAKFVCPKNLKNEHNRYLKKKREFNRKKSFKELKSKIKNDNEIYKKKKRRFLKLKFIDDNLVIEPIKTVKEFYKEGMNLDHCLFENEYHKKNNNLILSAKINGESVETIDFSLSSLKIIQSRGKNNQLSEHHSRIIKLMKSNINLIEKAI